MITFHYLICNVPKKEKYHVMKLVFMNNILNNKDEMFLTNNQYYTLKNSLEDNLYTDINDSKVNLESFLKNINLFLKN
tara:strand:+ start:1218 stop:1451 length:234 start_codon:yes stop_codon:yes gene_type:complete